MVTLPYMKFSFHWLKDYLDFNMAPEELADLLTLHSFETEIISQNKEEFGKNIILALDSSRTKDRITKGLDKAKAYSWESMVESMLLKVL